MSPGLLARLFQQRSQARLIRFDEQIVPQGVMTDLHPDLWQRFRTSRSDDESEVFLSKLGMARVDDDGTWRPTVAGVLMASDDPRRWLPNAFVQAVVYQGTDIRTHQPKGGPYQLDAADI